MLTQNALLREEIDSLRVERTRFEGIRKKLEKVRPCAGDEDMTDN